MPQRVILQPDFATTARLSTKTLRESRPYLLLVRACLKIMEGAVFAQKAGWQGVTKENISGGSLAEEQRSQNPRPQHPS
jgi:hypothetical protein